MEYEPKLCSRITRNYREWNRSREHLLLVLVSHLLVHLVSVFIVQSDCQTICRAENRVSRCRGEKRASFAPFSSFCLSVCHPPSLLSISFLPIAKQAASTILRDLLRD